MTTPPTPREIAEGIVGALGMGLALLTPMLRGYRSHWGLPIEDARRVYPGDERIPEPDWAWTHGIEIEALPSEVWPWVTQIGQDRGGFYSYRFLENLVGCQIEDVDQPRPEWSERRPGESLRMHPEMPPLPIVEVEPGHHLLAWGPPQPDAQGHFQAASWLLLVEPLDEGRRSRFISRFRAKSSHDLRTRLLAGPALTEPVGFVMDRRMLLGLQERVERKAAVRALLAKLRD